MILMVKDSVRNPLMLVVPPLAVTFLMWSIRLNELTLFEFLAAAGLLGAAWAPYYRWKLAGERYLPLFAMLSFMFWVYYALPLFWGDRRGYATRGEFSHESIEKAMLLAVIGVACLWIGKWTGVGRRLVSAKVLDLYADREKTWLYVRTALLISIPVAFTVESRAYLFGSGGRQLLAILTSTVSMALLVLMFRKFLGRQATHAETLLITVFLLGRFVAGMASGMLGAGAGLMITCSIAYLYERRRIPTVAIVLVCGYVLFFQPAKQAFRRTFWSERVDATLGQRISFWSSESLHNWQLALENPNEENWRLMANHSLARMSLLQQTAHVIELTPDRVPYQHGRLYSYMLVTLIPRAVWPNKPSVNEANQFYQVAYGLTNPEDLDKVSIAVGTVAESFINFGWWGPFLVMLPLGIFFEYFQYTCLARDSGWVLNAIGIALIPSFLTVESQLAQYLSGIVQCIAVSLLVLWPVLHAQLRSGRSSAQPPAELVAGGLGIPLPAFRRFL
jgi:hypothetical protein